MANSDKIEDTIREIAAKHGIAVGRDDPILILQTINERLMQDSAAAQSAMLDAFKSELEGIAHRWGEDSRGKAERTLNAALSASREAMAKGMESGSAAAVAVVRRELESLAAQLKRQVADARKVAMFNLVAGSMVLFAAGLAVWATR